MTAIERTAYPRFKQTFTEQELAEFYILTNEEKKLVHAKASGEKQQLALAVLLKGYQKLGFLPRVDEVPKQIRHHIAAQLTLPKEAGKAILDGLLVREKSETRNEFTRLKALPAKSSLKWVRQWEKHLERLEKIMDPQSFLAGLPSTKVEQFASQAYQTEISDIKGVKITEWYTIVPFDC